MTDGNTTIIENGGILTPQISHKNGSITNERDRKNQFGTPLLDASSKFSGNRSSRCKVSDESQQYRNIPTNGLSLQGQRQNPLSVSVSASNSPFVNKRMGSKQTLLQVSTFYTLIVRQFNVSNVILEKHGISILL